MHDPVRTSEKVTKNDEEEVAKYVKCLSHETATSPVMEIWTAVEYEKYTKQTTIVVVCRAVENLPWENAERRTVCAGTVYFGRVVINFQ